MVDKNLSGARIVTGLFTDSKAAANAIANLINAGFERKCLSVVGADSDQFRELTSQLVKKGPDSLLIYSSILGALFGAACGLYSIDSMPASKYFLAIIPLMSVLVGAAAGAYFGLLLAGLVHFDTPTYESKIETQAVKKGILISVSVKDSSARFRAENI